MFLKSNCLSTWATTFDWHPLRPWDQPDHASITERYTSTTEKSVASKSIMIREFNGEEVVKTVNYQDIFPNELSLMYSPHEVLKTITNERDESYTMDIIDMESILTHSKNQDAIPSIYDSKMTIEHGEIKVENALETTQVISIPGYYSGVSGIESYEITGIEVVPADGIYYDKEDKINLVSGKYIYYDGNGDSVPETIFAVDSNGVAIAVGFDYDGDLRLIPDKHELIYREVEDPIIVEPSNTLIDLDYVRSHSLLNLEEPKASGYFLEPAFSDAFYELWKISYSQGTSQLIKEVTQKTSDDMLEQLDFKQHSNDIAWQVISQLGGVALSIPAGAFGYFIGYGAINYLHSWIDEQEQQNAIKAYTYTSDGSTRTPVDITGEWWMDTWFGGLPTNPLTGNGQGVYAVVREANDAVEYTAQLVLAESGESKSSHLGQTYLAKDLDYHLQTRNHFGYSDVCEDLINFFDTAKGDYKFSPEVIHHTNSLTFIENEINSRTTGKWDKVLPYTFGEVPMLGFGTSDASSQYPEFYLDVPIKLSQDKLSALSEEDASELMFKIIEEGDISSESEVNSLQIVPADAVHSLGTIVSFTIHAYCQYDNVIDLGDGTSSITYEKHAKEIITITEDVDTEESEIAYNNATGILNITTEHLMTGLNHLNFKVQDASKVHAKLLIIEVKTRKYATHDSASATESDTRIAAMQAVGASLMEYYYQFNLATQSQTLLEELAYTVKITMISTAITMGITAATSWVAGKFNARIAGADVAQTTSQKFAATVSKKLMSRGMGVTLPGVAYACLKESFEEVWIDPILESIGENFVAYLGGPRWMQLAGSLLLESGRETALGPITGMFKSDTSTQVSFEQYLKQEEINPYGRALVDQYDSYKTDIKAQWNAKTWAQKYGGMLLSTLALFSTTLTGVSLSSLIGPTISSVFSTLALIGISGLDLDESFSNYMEKKFLADMVGSELVNLRSGLIQVQEMIYSVSERNKVQLDKVTPSFLKKFSKILPLSYQGADPMLYIINFGSTLGLDVSELTLWGGKVNSEVRFAQNPYIIADIQTESMNTLFNPKDKIPVKLMPKGTQYQVGEIAAFYDKEGNLVVHRLENYLVGQNGKLYYVTEGTNNPSVDEDLVCEDDIIGIADLSEEAYARVQELSFFP